MNMKSFFSDKRYMAVTSGILLLFIMAMIFILKEYRDSDNYIFDLSLFENKKSHMENGVLVADKDADMNTDIAISKAMWLSEGTYRLEITYLTNKQARVELFINNNQNIQTIYLDPTNGKKVTQPYVFSTDSPTDRAKIRLYVSEDSDLEISRMELFADHKIYKDAFFHSILAILFCIAFFAMLRQLWLGRHRDFIIDCFILMAMITVVSIPFYMVKNGGALFCVDTRTHMMRIEGIAEGLRDGQYPVIIAPNLFNEFGELTFMYPNLFLYPYGILRFFNISMAASYRAMMVVTNCIAALCTYFAGRSMGFSRRSNLIYTFLYLICPHRLFLVLSLGTAGAQGLAVGFIPLCIAGAFLLLKDDKKGIPLVVIGISGTMQSHILTFLLILLCLIMMVILNVRRVLDNRAAVLIKMIKAVGLALFLNLGFLVIFIRYYFTDWNKAKLQNLWDFRGMTLGMADIMQRPSEWLYISVMILVTVLLIVFRAKNKEIGYSFALQCTILAVFNFILSTKLVPWDFVYEHMGIIKGFVQYIQDTHRFYSLIEPLLLTALLITAKWVYEEMITGNKKLVAGIEVVLGIILFISVANEMAGYMRCETLLYDQITGDINTIEQLDYVPVGTTEETYSSDVGRLSDEEGAESISYSKRGTHIDYEYKSNIKEEYADLPLLYYYGYRAENEKGERLDISKAANGRILVKLEEGGPHAMYVRFRVKPVFTFLYLLMIGSWIVYLLNLILKRIKIKK